MSNSDALIGAWLLDGNGGGRKLDWEQVQAWQPGDGVLWVHLDRAATEAGDWLAGRASLPAVFAEALQADETRPRVRIQNDYLMLILRAVNLNPGADPDDMVQLRVYADGRRIISLREQPVKALQDLVRALPAGKGPTTSAQLVVQLSELITARINEVVEGLQDQVDDLEEAVLAGDTQDLRTALADLRHQGIALRRYILPQREALLELLEEPPGWMTDSDLHRLHEVAERTTRHAEDLNSARERAAVIQDELTNRLAERLSRIMYVLSIIASLFLPLTFLTGLFGMNVAGLPGTEEPWSFYVVCLILVVVIAVQVWLFKWWKWF